MGTSVRHTTRRIAAGLLVLASAACASSGPGNGGGLEALAPRPDLTWRVTTRYQVDVWLHGYAMLQDDTTLVPFFKPGYRDSITAIKRRENLTTRLDSDYTNLRDSLRANPDLVNGQFLGLNFASWDAMEKALDGFLAADGDLRKLRNNDLQDAFFLIAQTYPSAADRAWLRSFVAALRNDDTVFYHKWWTAQQTARAPVIAAFDSLWSNVYLTKFRPFLDKSGQSRGEILLSIPLDGEGRTLGGGTPVLAATTPQREFAGAEQGPGRFEGRGRRGEPRAPAAPNATTKSAANRGPTIAVELPDSAAAAVDALYVLAHELVGTIANQAIADNTTPAEKRDHVADRFASPAAVRGGELLLQKIAPELAQGYARFYLQHAHISFTPGDEAAALERAFPLRETIAQQLSRQLVTVTSGN